MKKLFQSVALALVVILAAQPAFATMTCVTKVCGAGDAVADCCPPSGNTAMRDMANNSAVSSMAMHAALAGSSCTSEPCCVVSARTTPQLVTPAKSGASQSFLATPVDGLSSVAAPVRVVLAPGNPAAPAAARYVLFQVFRI